MEKPTSPELDLDNLRAIKVLGKGAMGTVFLVHNKLSDPSASCPFALKVVEKSCLHSKLDADRRARWEITVLSSLKDQQHDFLPSLIGSLETQEILAWAVPFCSGGDLNVRRYNQTDHIFSPSIILFYLAEIVCALEHLHSMNIVYRDLKPENVLIQQSGHVTLTDFDLSRTLSPKSLMSLITETTVEAPPPNHRNLTRIFPVVFSEKKLLGLKKTKSARVSPENRKHVRFSFCSNGERSDSFVGTEEYVAPEMIRGDGHEFAVDWWALGILSYEMLNGVTPFRGKTRIDTFRRILMMQPVFTGKPTALTDLITKLLEKDPTRRLGYRRGACEIKEHEFFRGLNWDLLTEVVRPPYIPSIDDVEVTMEGRGIDILEYFKKLREPPPPFGSPSIDDCGYNVSLTEF